VRDLVQRWGQSIRPRRHRLLFFPFSHPFFMSPPTPPTHPHTDRPRTIGAIGVFEPAAQVHYAPRPQVRHGVQAVHKRLIARVGARKSDIFEGDSRREVAA
jgi:hypothetical protein